MGFSDPTMSLLVSPCHFLHAQKVTNPNPVPKAFGTGREPNACLSADRLQPARLAHPWLGKEASALFCWLVLRTATYRLISNILTYRDPIIHGILVLKPDKSFILPHE